MYRIDNATATPDHKFTEGNPATGVPATDVDADWLNNVQEELAAAIEAAGVVLDKTKTAQLLEALRKLDYVADTGVANAYVVNLPGTLADHIPGMRIRFLALNTNNAASTLKVDDLAPAAMTRPDGSAVQPGDIKAGQLVEVARVGAGYQMTSTPAAWGEYAPETTLADAATITWNWSTQQNAKVTLGGNRTLAAPTGLAAGKYATVRIAQDATGGRSLSFASNYKGVSDFSLSTGASEVDWLLFRGVDGANCELVGYRNAVGA